MKGVLQKLAWFSHDILLSFKYIQILFGSEYEVDPYIYNRPLFWAAETFSGICLFVLHVSLRAFPKKEWGEFWLWRERQSFHCVFSGL